MAPFRRAGDPSVHTGGVAIALETPGVDDAAALADLKAATFVESFAAQNDPEQMAAHVARSFTPVVVAAELADPCSATVWALHNSTPVGYLKVNFEGSQSEPGLGDGLEIEQVYLRASHQGQGLGGRLIGHAEGVAREHVIAFVWLGVWEHNDRAVAVYRRRGFEVFDEHTFVLGDEVQRDLLMRKPL